MILYIIAGLIGFCLGILCVFLFSVLKINSIESKREEKKAQFNSKYNLGKELVENDNEEDSKNSKI